MKSWLRIERIYGKDGEHETPYLTRIVIGRLRFHKFHRGDADPDMHDHPWSFWTFPLTSYVEQTPMGFFAVKRFQWHFRPATYAHRVLGPVSEVIANSWPWPTKVLRPPLEQKPIYTIVWMGEKERDWGFFVRKDECLTWVPWREYVFGSR